MSLQSDLIQRLIVLSTAAGSKIYDSEIPQGVSLPFVALQKISGNQPTDLSGVGLLKRATVRAAVFGRSAVERDAIGDAIRDDLKTVRGDIGDTIVSSIRVETSSDEVAVADGDNIVKGSGLDLFIVYY